MASTLEKCCNEAKTQQLELLQESSRSSCNISTNHETSAVNDLLDMNLQTVSEMNENDVSQGLEDEQRLLEDLRKYKDENGRLFKLLSEKEFEIRKMRKTIKELQENSFQLKDSGLASTSSDAAIMKVMELSKKLRDLNAELLKERSQNSQLKKQLQATSVELKNGLPERRNGDSKRIAPKSVSELPSDAEMQRLKYTIKELEKKLSETKIQNQTMSIELKKAVKALSEEIGDPTINVHEILTNSNSQWRGRQQKIIALTDKIRKLEKELACQKRDSMQNEKSSASNLSLSTVTREDIHLPSVLPISQTNFDYSEGVKERNKVKQLESKISALEEAHVEVKQKLDASKLRNKTLSTECRATKEQVKKLLEKAKHDDELIMTLLKQQDHLKAALESTIKTKKIMEETRKVEVSQLSQKDDQSARMVERLKNIIQEKEKEIQHLKFSGNTPVGQKISDQTTLTPTMESAATQTLQSPGTPSDDAPHWIRAEVPSVDDTSTPSVDIRVLEVERDRLRNFIDAKEQCCSELFGRNLQLEQVVLTFCRRQAYYENILKSHNIAFKAFDKETISNPLISDEIDNDCVEEELKYVKDMESLKLRIMHQHDEIISLKCGLKSVLDTKKKDLKMLKEIIEETQKQYLMSLKK